jgi:3-isopropylmalate/(R)-2-methylmalate dehydratase small subunit
VLALISKDAFKMVSTGDKIELDLENNILLNLTTGKFCKFEPLPNFILEIVEAGGIIPHINKKLKN